MCYHTTLAATLKKLFWLLLPLLIIVIDVIIDPQDWLEALQSNYFVALGVLVVIIYVLAIRRILAEHWAELYIDDHLIRFTIYGRSAGLWWLTCSMIILKREYRFPASHAWVLTVKGIDGRIRCFLSDLAPEDQAAIEKVLETKWGYIKNPPDRPQS